MDLVPLLDRVDEAYEMYASNILLDWVPEAYEIHATNTLLDGVNSQLLRKPASSDVRLLFPRC